MIRKILLPSLALLGALFALFIVFWSTRKAPTPPVLFPPAVSPFTASIAGAGVIEASSRNISVGNPLTQIVTEVYVCEGDRVKAGDKLFKIDTRPLEAQLATAQATLASAQMTYEDKRAQYAFYERLTSAQSVSEQARTNAYFAAKEAEEQLKVAENNIKAIEINIALSVVCSPIDAFILQVNTRPGMIAIAELPPVTPTAAFNTFQAPNVLLGCVDPLMLRIDIDEADAWRYRPGAAAQAFVRGNSKINFPLTFVRVEPYIIPKVSFTGDVAERIDTRVLQLLYSFEWGDLPIYPGQILDVFIESEPLR